MKTYIERRWQGHPIWQNRFGETKIGLRFWLETATLSLFFGGMIGLAIQLTGRESEVIAVALSAGIIWLARLIAVRQ